MEPNNNNQENNESRDTSYPQENSSQTQTNNPENPNENADSSSQILEPGDLLGTINNNIFLSESTLETLYTILFSKGSYLDDVTLKEDNLGEKFGNILSGRRQSLFAILGDKMQFYHSRLIDGELSHLEKLMKVLRSKKREMRLQRLEGEEAKTEEEKNEEENERKEENEIKVKI